MRNVFRPCNRADAHILARKFSRPPGRYHTAQSALKSIALGGLETAMIGKHDKSQKRDAFGAGTRLGG